MVRINYTNEFGAHHDAVEGSMTVKEFCENNAVRTDNSRQLMLNGVVVRGAEMDKPLSAFANDNDEIDVIFSAKLDNAA